MFELDTKSLNRLHGVDKRLVDLAKQVAKITPIRFQITEGYRDRMRQKELYAEGKSKIDGEIKLGKHQLGKAVDIVCCKEGYTEPLRDIYIVVGLFIAVAKQLNIKIRVGALWDKTSTKDNNFVDAFHIQVED